MDTTVTLLADAPALAGQLRLWLEGQDGLRGRTSQAGPSSAPAEATADQTADGTAAAADQTAVDAAPDGSFVVALAPGEVAVSFVTGVVAWLRSRDPGVRLRITRPDGVELELETTLAGRITTARLPGIVTGLAAWAAGDQLDNVVALALLRLAAMDPRSAREGGLSVL